MALASLLRDTITLVKQNGETFTNIKASVQKTKIYTQRADLIIETGDIIERTATNGLKESYRVIDPGFHEKLHSIPAGYQMDVQKLGVPQQEHTSSHVTYNIQGSNNRINQNSVDNSVNIVNETNELQQKLNELREEIAKLSLPEPDEKSSQAIVSEVEEQLKKPSPSKVVIKALFEALPKVANIAAITTFILAHI